MLRKVSLHKISAHKISVDRISAQKILPSILIAVCLTLMLAIAVSAQTDTPDDEQAELLDADPLVASVVQSVPVTLTFSVPGTDGTVTVEVPIILSFDIQVGIGSLGTTSVVTTSVVATTTVVTDSQSAIVVTPTASPTAAPTNTPTPQPTATLVPPTPTPAATEAPPEEEATSEPAPTIALPTPTPSASAQDTADTPATETDPLTQTTTITQTTSVTQASPIQSVVTSPNCPDPRSVIASPIENESVSGTAEFFGTATHDNFWYYKLEYLPVIEESEVGEGTPVPEPQFAFLADAQVQVADGQLAAVDTTELDNGVYTIRLTVVDNTGNFPPPCTVTITIQN